MSPSIPYIILILLATNALAIPLDHNDEPNDTNTNLNPSCSPGGNFDLSHWNLQLPTGDSGKPDRIDSSELTGCSGYKSQYFSTSDTGALVLEVPGSPSSSGCVTTANSNHCRTELRQVNPETGESASWDPKAKVNRLRVELAVPTADDSEHGTVIGQIHVDDSVSNKPVCELFIDKKGELTMGVEQIPKKSSLKYTKLDTKIGQGDVFEYEIRYEQGKLSVSINDEGFQTLGTGSLNGPPSYFKVGNYNQGDSESKVVIYAIDVKHS